jgi:CRP-like cAMP-binding protein
MDPKYLEIASRSTLFRGIDSADILHVMGCLEYKILHFEKNEYIARIGTPFKGVYIVLEGESAIVRETYDGSRSIVNLFNVGDVCGEALAFCGLNRWPMSYQALTDSTVLVVHPERIIDVCERACIFHKTILSNMIRVIARKACDLNRKVEYLMLKTINGKLSKYLLEQKELNASTTFHLPMNKEKLADFLNISRPSMSRELGRMRDEGIIEFHKSTFRIVDEERLKALLEE